MGLFVDSTLDALKKSVNLKLWFYYLLVTVALLLSAFVLVLVLGIIAFIVFLVLKLELIALIFYFILAVAGILLLVLLSSAASGVYINLARDYLEKGKFSLHEAWDKTIPRIFTAFKVNLIVFAVAFTAFILWALPLVIGLISFFEKNKASFILSAAGEFAGNQLGGQTFARLFIPFILASLVWIVAGILIFLIVFLALWPMLILLETIPYFEEIGSFQCFKRAFHLGKKNYLSNYFFIGLLIAVLFAVTIPYLLVSFILSALEKAAALTVALVFVSFILAVISFVIQIIYSMWSSSFSNLIAVTVYKFNTQAEKIEPKTKTELKPSKPKEKQRNPWASMKKKK